jgi:excinuclease ABC subunit C
VLLNHDNILSALPSKPGVYQFLDASGKVIYVGKARDLKKRISSYFSKIQPGKTAVMLNRAADIRHIVTKQNQMPFCSKTTLSKNTSQNTIYC